MADLIAELRLKVRTLGIGVLNDVVEHGGGDDVIRIVSALQMRRYLERVDEKRRTITPAKLIAVPSSERTRSPAASPADHGQT